MRRAVRTAEKIRAQDLFACKLIAFAHGNRFQPNAVWASRVGCLSPASDDPRVIAKMAARMADAMFVEGAVYTKCGVMLVGLEHVRATQTDLFSKPDPRWDAPMAAIDEINDRFGQHPLRLASVGVGTKRYDTKRAFKSGPWTTNIAEIPVAC